MSSVVGKQLGMAHTSFWQRNSHSHGLLSPGAPYETTGRKGLIVASVRMLQPLPRASDASPRRRTGTAWCARPNSNFAGAERTLQGRFRKIRGARAASDTLLHCGLPSEVTLVKLFIKKLKKKLSCHGPRAPP
jgi:hypothetical protein